MPSLNSINLLFISGFLLISFFIPNTSALVTPPTRQGKVIFGTNVSHKPAFTQTHTHDLPHHNVGSDMSLHANFGRSGNKRERLEKLAALEEEKLETDKGFVVKAAGGFVGLMVVLLVAGLAGGVFDELLLKAM